MRASDLALDQLLELPHEGGFLRFAGQRAMLFDAHALGVLRKELVDTFGLATARTVMTRVGYADGWRTADLLERALPWTSVDEWRRAGGHLHRLRGMATFEPVAEHERADPPALTEAIWRDSYEVEQHLLHFGQAEEAVCWSLLGFASGYSSRAFGRALACVEVQCRGRGDPLCRMRGDEQPRAESCSREHGPRARADGPAAHLDGPTAHENVAARENGPAARENGLAARETGPAAREDGPAARQDGLAARERVVDMRLASIEREHILSVLAASGGNKAEAARRLGIGTATLFRKLKRYRE